MDEDLKNCSVDPKIQQLFEQLLADVMHSAAYSPHSTTPPISMEVSVFTQISRALALPIPTIEQILSSKYNVLHIATPSIISSNEAIELYARYFSLLNFSELPWLPLQTIGPGMVVCHFMPNFPVQDGLPEDLISKVIIPPKDYFALADELREADIAAIRRHLEITTTAQNFTPLSDIFSLSPKKFAQHILHLFLPTSNTYIELQKLAESLDEENSTPEAFLDTCVSLFPEEVSSWVQWRYKLKILASNPFFSKLGAEYFGFFRPLELIDPKAPILDKLPQMFLHKIWSYNFGVLALNDRTLFLVKDIAISDTDDGAAMSELRKISGQYLLKFAYCVSKDLIAYISNQRDTYSALRAKSKLIETTAFSNIDAQSHILELSQEDELSDNKIADFVNSILAMAIEQGASDIHIEPLAENCVIRYRLDGVLHRQIDSIPGVFLPNIINRVKTLATNMDITDANRPQDGRARVSYMGRNIDLRIATIPIESEAGLREKCVIRILDNTNAPDKLDTIFWDAYQRAAIRNAISAPYGCIIVTGPTGSGKSTTLYTLLQELNSVEKNIMTAEDPVERKLLGVQQVAVSNNVTFAGALRSFLRMDPDIILIGETRDDETAKLTMRAAQTGHLCLTTLHTNSALGAIERLSHLGVKGHDIASSLLMVTGQRLLRTLCPQCKRKVKLTSAQLELFKRYGITSELVEEGYCYAPPLRGCRGCHGTGFVNRIAITETIPIDEEFRNAIITQASHKELSQIAQSKKLHPMFYYGLSAVARGITDFTELHKLMEGF